MITPSYIGVVSLLEAEKKYTTRFYWKLNFWKILIVLNHMNRIFKYISYISLIDYVIIYDTQLINLRNSSLEFIIIANFEKDFVITYIMIFDSYFGDKTFILISYECLKTKSFWLKTVKFRSYSRAAISFIFRNFPSKN